MHPIERLRWIARAHGEAPATLAAEAAWTISELALYEAPAVVTACRRLLESHVTVGPLWWVAATVLAAPEPDEAARRAVEELCSDPTAELLADSLGRRFGADALLVVGCPADTVREALGYQPSMVVRVVGSWPWLRSELRGFAAASEVSGWDFGEAPQAVDGATVTLVEALAAGPGGVLLAAEAAVLARSARSASIPLWAVAGVGTVLNDQLFGEMQRRAGDEVVLIETDVLDAVVGPVGLENPATGLCRPGCPAAPELLVRAG